MPTYMSQVEYAKHRGVSQPNISKLIDKGKIPDSCIKKIGKYNRIDRDLADAALEQNLDRIYNPVKKTKQKKKKKPTPEEQQETVEAAELDPAQSLAESQRQKALYDAAIRKLELEEKSGESLKKEDVEKEYYEIARRTRDAILNVPNRISAEIASMKNVHLVSEKITSELTAALEELSI